MFKEGYEHGNDAHEPESSWVGVLIGLLIGGLLGAAAMLLLAPQSGKRTRAKLLRQGHELREQTEEAVGDAVTQARGEVRKVTKDVRKQAKALEQRGQAVLNG